jgi:hypothetical protein
VHLKLNIFPLGFQRLNKLIIDIDIDIGLND